MDNELIALAASGCSLSCYTDFTTQKTTVTIEFTDRQRGSDFSFLLQKKVKEYLEWHRAILNPSLFRLCKHEKDQLILHCLNCEKVFWFSKDGTTNAYWHWEENQLRPQCPHCLQKG